MEEKQTSLGTHTLIYGVITGAALIVFSLIMYVSNLYMNQTLGYISFLIMFAGMVLGSMQYRKVQLKGYMTYGQAFSANFLIGLFAAIVSTIFFFFYIKYINTGLIEEILAQARTKIEAKAGNMSQEQMDQAMMWTERFMTPVWMVIWGFLGYAFWAAIFSLIISIFMRKKNPNAPTMI
ncbi:MAG: DUF4199 domain-containing protein [Bacteroidales bacterium]|jgi:hypothetical protein